MKLACLVSLFAVSAFGQLAKPAVAKPAVPRTPDGHVDFQGNWLSNAATPFERPQELTGKLILPDDEVVELNRRAKKIFAPDSGSDAASADGYFMAAYRNLKVYKLQGATDSSERVTELEIDNRTSLITDPPDGKQPAYTEAGRLRRAAYGKSRAGTGNGPEEISPSDRCITYGVPRVNGVYAVGLHGYYQIVQTKDQLLLFSENIHEPRIIDLTGRPHLPAWVGSWAGDSVGHWEGDTLVVDTTNFKAQLHPLGISTQFHLTEKFRRVGANGIEYEMTFNDPDTWVRPWTAMIRLKHTDDRLFESACHEGNESIMKTILSDNVSK